VTASRGFHVVNRSALSMTETLESAIAPPAIAGLSSPMIAKGTATPL